MKKTSLLVVAAALLSTGVAQADTALIDYQGYSWETGGFPPSSAGDELKFVGVVDALDSRFGVNLGTNEVTIYVHSLLSTGEVDIGGGVLSIAYSGGNIELYQDGTPDRDYGTNPPNPTAPPTFVDGSPFLIGTLSNFFLFFDPSSGGGAFEGDCSFTSGSGLTTLNQLNASGYTFGGVLDATVSANIPVGYQLAVDGSIEVEVIVGVEERSWGAVKDLFRK
jgi:hypothetical protein